MNKDLIRFNTAVKAKEKGFPQHHTHYYTIGGEEQGGFYQSTQSTLQAWLRNKNLHVCADLSSPSSWFVRVDSISLNDFLYHSIDDNLSFQTYEDALEHGLFEALNLL